MELREAVCLSQGCAWVRAVAQSHFLLFLKNDNFSYFLGPGIYQRHTKHGITLTHLIFPTAL